MAKIEIVKPVRFADIVGIKSEKPDEIISGLLRRRRIAMIAGDPGLGKSTFAQQLVCSAVASKQFLDHNITSGKIVYCNMEVEDLTFFSRFAYVAEQEGLNPAEINNVELISMETGCEISDLADALIEQYKEQDVSLVIIDPMYSIIARMGDVNSLSTTTDFTNEIKRIKQALNCSVILIHHFRKHEGYTPDNNTMQLMNGSYGLSYMSNAIVTLLNSGHLTRNEKQQIKARIVDRPDAEEIKKGLDTAKKVKVVYSKMSDFADRPSRYVAFINGLYMDEFYDILNKGKDDTPDAAPTQAEIKILAAYDDLAARTSEITAKDIIDATGLATGTVYEFLKNSKHFVKEGKYYYRKEA